MEVKSRAEYFRKRRESRKQFVVLLDAPLMDAFTAYLQEKGITRKDWLLRQINSALEEKEE